MSTHPIEFFNRYSQKIETEIIYGEPFLRWSYDTFLGRSCTSLIFKRLFFSKLYGVLMNMRQSKSKVMPFIEMYHLDAREFDANPEDYRTFNQFFYRKLKPEARPVDTDQNHVVFPADGRHLGFQDLSKVENVFVKGQSFNLNKLLGDAKEAERYREGTLVLSRLCPVDYHRFHFPVTGQASKARHIAGPLYSVNPFALRRNLEILSENRRVITVVETADFGRVLCIEVGATCVGSIEQTFTPDSRVKKGEEKGYFAFGGSSVLTIFEKSRIVLADDLVENSARGLELYSHFGDFMGKKWA